jgi:hypothetical protein
MTNAVKEDPMIRDVLAAAMKGATDVAVRVTSLTGTGTGSEKKTKNEGTATASTTDTAIVIETEITTGTVVDAGVRKTATMHKKIVTRGDVARKVRMRRLLTLPLGTVHAGVLRELIPGIVMVIDVPDILVIPETNSTTRPGTGGIVGDAAMSAVLARKMTPLGASHPHLPHLRWRTPSASRMIVPTVR